MGFGTTFAMIMFLIVFAGMGLMMVTMQKNMAESAATLAQEQQRLREQQKQDLNIVTTSYSQPGILIPWTVTYADEFEKGTLVNTTLIGDSIELAGTSTAGNYTSEAYDAGHQSNFTTLSFSAVAPGGTVLEFQIRTANTTAALDAATFVGPDATAGTYYNITGQTINGTHNRSRYIQYKAYFNTTIPGTSATLQDTTINVQRGVGHVIIQTTNDGAEKLNFEETDVYIDGVRVSRETNGRELDEEIGSDIRLWNPGEELNITAFYNLSAVAQVVVTNGHARDQDTVTP